MKISTRELAFLVYFLPLFALKMLDITADNNLLKITAGCCFILFAMYMFYMKFNNRLLKLFLLLLIYTVILIFTCGKQGAFFSVVMLLAMKDINMDNKNYKICFWVGVVFFIVACYLNKDGAVAVRFMNGEWVNMNKRSNILYVAFTALVSLYLLIYRDKLNNMRILGVAIVNYLIYMYVGSRTGVVSIFFLVILVLLFRNQYFRRLKIIKYGCIFAPLVCMVFSIFAGLKYDEYSFLKILDMMLQGRIAQNNAYLDRYDIKLFGQHIYEGAENGDFWNLDCAYLDMLICEGLIFAVLWIVVSTALIKYMYNNNRMVEVAILVMYAIYGISETFLLNCFLNMSLFLYGEYLYIQFNKIPNPTQCQI